MTDWQCARCRAQVAPGAPRCPECPSTEFEEPEADEMLKIARDGSVSDSADVRAAGTVEAEQLADVEATLGAEPFMVEGGSAGPEGLEVLKVPAEGSAADAQGPDAAPEPAPVVPPRTPPRRPPAVPRE